MPVVPFGNNKGGAGKTALVVGLAEALATQGDRVLVVDLDPQANATRRLGLEEEDLSGLPTVSEAIKSATPGCAGDAVTSSRWKATDLAERIDLVPSRFDLENRIPEAGQVGAGLRLRRALDGVTADYDWTLIDCPPSLGHLTQLALVCADGVVIPLRPEYDYVAGAVRLRDFLRQHAGDLGVPGLDVAGVIVNELDRRKGLHSYHVESVNELFPGKVWGPIVPARAAIAEANDAGIPLAEYGGPVARDLAATLVQLAGRLKEALLP